MCTDNTKTHNVAVSKEDFLSKICDFENTLQENISVIKSDIDTLSKSQEAIKQKVDYIQYLNNKNNIIIHGIPDDESDNAALLNKIMETLNGKFKTKLTKADINFTYRLGKKSEKIRPVLIGFLHRWKRDNIYAMKKMCKGSELFICEWLPTNALSLLRQARTLFGNDSWVQNGLVHVKKNGSIKVIKCQNDLKN